MAADLTERIEEFHNPNMPRKITFWDKFFLAAYGIVSASAIIAVVAYESYFKKNNLPDAGNPAVVSPLEDKLPRYRILGRAEVRVQDMERVSDNLYLIKNSRTMHLYEFDAKGKRIIIYPLREE